MAEKRKAASALPESTEPEGKDAARPCAKCQTSTDLHSRRNIALARVHKLEELRFTVRNALTSEGVQYYDRELAYWSARLRSLVDTSPP